MYPLSPIEKPIAPYRIPPGKFVFCVQEFFSGSYSQKSLVPCFILSEPVIPVPTYPLFPMEKATAEILGGAGRASICPHGFFSEADPEDSFPGEYFQKVFRKLARSVPDPTNALSPTENATAFSKTPLGKFDSLFQQLFV